MFAGFIAGPKLVDYYAGKAAFPPPCIVHVLADMLVLECVESMRWMADIFDQITALKAADSPDLVIEAELGPQIGCDAYADGTFQPDLESAGSKKTRPETPDEDKVLPGAADTAWRDRVAVSDGGPVFLESYDTFLRDAIGLDHKTVNSILRTAVDSKAQVVVGGNVITVPPAVLSQLGPRDRAILNSPVLLGMSRALGQSVESDLHPFVRDVLTTTLPPEFISASVEAAAANAARVTDSIHGMAEKLRAQAKSVDVKDIPPEAPAFWEKYGDA
jgi:hypothetical protein